MMNDFGFIYFIYNFQTKKTKIGKTSKHPVYHLKKLQVGNGIKLELLHFYESDQVSKEELELHSKYTQYRTIEEWFELPLPLLLELTHAVPNKRSNSLAITENDSISIQSQNNNKFAHLPQEVQNIIFQNASSTISVQVKGNNKGKRYKCYDSHNRCIGRIKGSPGSMYWQPDVGQYNQHHSKKMDSLNIAKGIGISVVKSFL
ncbi:MAG: GIY-YIG nuclease family protein [Cyanobacteria bacterium P01_G01_bin.39]